MDSLPVRTVPHVSLAKPATVPILVELVSSVNRDKLREVEASVKIVLPVMVIPPLSQEPVSLVLLGTVPKREEFV